LEPGGTPAAKMSGMARKPSRRKTYAVVRGRRDSPGIPAARELTRRQARAAARDPRNRKGATGRGAWRVISDDELTYRTRGSDTMAGTTKAAKRREARKRAADRRRRSARG
jgi:hypothetical protein